MKVVVSDTSPVRALAHTSGLCPLPSELFSCVRRPPRRRGPVTPPSGGIRSPSIFTRSKGYRVVAPTDLARIAAASEILDRGESEAIALALEIHADGLLIDEAAGRAEAKRLGLVTIGVIGLLHRAKIQGRVPAVLPLLDRLRDEAKFFVSDALREQAKRLCRE